MGASGFLRTEDSLFKYPDIPLNRAHLGEALKESERFLANVDYTERGWHSLFNVLTHPFLDFCDFNKPLTEEDDGTCMSPCFPR
jgi:hypothetical protein